MNNEEDELTARIVRLSRRPEDDDSASTQQPDQRSDSTVTWGFVTAILLAPVGLFFGIRLLVRDRIGPGIAVILVALLSMGLGIAYVSSQDSGSSSSTSDDSPCIITFSGSTLCGLDAINWCVEFDPTNESSGCSAAMAP